MAGPSGTAGREIIRNVSTEGLRFRLVDAKGEVLGRLASQISRVLQGKDKPTFSRDRDMGDVVVVVNAAEVTLTGKKLEDKTYIRHTGYPGGIRETTASELMQSKPTEVLRKAVERMLPKNRTRADRLRKLRLFPGPDHPGFDAAALTPLAMPPRRIRNKFGLPPDFQLPEGVLPMNPRVWDKFEKLRGQLKGPAAAAAAAARPEGVSGGAEAKAGGSSSSSSSSSSGWSDSESESDSSSSSSSSSDRRQT